MKKKSIERVLVVTSEWPSQEHPYAGVFVLRQVQALQKLGLQVDVVNFRGRMNPLIYRKTYLKLRQLLKVKDYDLIHAHFGQAGFLAALQKKCPVVVTFHGSDLYGLAHRSLQSRLKSWALKKCSTLAKKKASAIISVSQRLSENIKCPVHEISTGVDLSLFKPCSKQEARKIVGLPIDQKIILFIGNPINPIKRHSLAQQAVSLISDEMPNIKLKVCHNVSPESMPNYFNAADILIITSAHEGASMTAIEALACNVPIVSVDVGHIRQYVESIDGCSVCADDRPETIASELKRVIKDKKRINGREVVKDMDEALIAKRVIDVYEQVLNCNQNM